MPILRRHNLWMALSIQGHVTSGVRHLFEPKIMSPILPLILGLFKDILELYRVVFGLLESHINNLIAVLRIKSS